ncbi:putative kelch repeat protein [Erysiphe neolycopersici]|uniref:Putative kelch repeat protein n=1 Tax=Erysiphe neolycopersici TaxID=212602 RepID=A0A420I7W2_9PEZI|nr:putative kelch repeat protein [Erysiphe neolycopersici]
MAQPSTPGVGVPHSSTFGLSTSNIFTGITPSSTTSSNNTFLMPISPLKGQLSADGYRPKITRTLGNRPACLVNASVTYCGNNKIYAFGGFDQYTDEVYNHVLKLDMVSYQWSLVDNYGDIPGVRMGHTATLYQGDKLLIFGGENEHRTYLSDLIVFDLKTAHWTQPTVSGPLPKGRARHAAVLHENKLFITGGITGHNNYVLEDICYLDLGTFTWSRVWKFVGRFDHSAYIWDDRVWVFGGMGEEMDKIGDIWWLDLKGSPAFDSPPGIGTLDRNSVIGRVSGSSRAQLFNLAPTTAIGSSGYAANSSSAQVNVPSFQLTNTPPIAPGTISSIRFHSGPDIPSQGTGTHFHVYTSGTLLDFITPGSTITPQESSLYSLDLETLRWQKLAEGKDTFRNGFRWHYCTTNDDGTKAWLLGCPTDSTGSELGPSGFEEYLSDIMEFDLRRYGIIGNNILSEPRRQSSRLPPVDRVSNMSLKGLGADLAKLFDVHPDNGSGTDFTITAMQDCEIDESVDLKKCLSKSNGDWLDPNTATSPPIYVHKLILQARWPHFARLYNAQMAEFHTKRMHIPEPYSVVKAFLYYLYTDTIQSEPDFDLTDVAGMLVMSNIYNMPNLRLLCVNRLAKEMNVDDACTIWYSAGIANEEWLRKRAASFCLLHWGRVVRTQGFLKLPRAALVEMSQEIDIEGRVVGGEELEFVGGLGGNRFGFGGEMSRKVSTSSNHTQVVESDDENEDMELT